MSGYWVLIIGGSDQYLCCYHGCLLYVEGLYFIEGVSRSVAPPPILCTAPGCCERDGWDSSRDEREVVRCVANTCADLDAVTCFFSYLLEVGGHLGVAFYAHAFSACCGWAVQVYDEVD